VDRDLTVDRAHELTEAVRHQLLHHVKRLSGYCARLAPRARRPR
jgi:hypothetical protein